MCVCVLTTTVFYDFVFFFFQAEDGIRDRDVTGVQTCALPISRRSSAQPASYCGWRARHRARATGSDRAPIDSPRACITYYQCIGQIARSALNFLDRKSVV